MITEGKVNDFFFAAEDFYKEFEMFRNYPELSSIHHKGATLGKPHPCDNNRSQEFYSIESFGCVFFDLEAHNCDICSRLLPLVSGTRRDTNQAAKMHMLP